MSAFKELVVMAATVLVAMFAAAGVAQVTSDPANQWLGAATYFCIVAGVSWRRM